MKARTIKAPVALFSVATGAFLIFMLTMLAGSENTRARAQGGADLDLLLVLAIDCSWSVDQREFALQARGMAAAFRSPRIHKAIASGALGRIAVSVVQWSDASQQVITVPWRIVGPAASADRLAAEIENMPRRVQTGGTSISAMMSFGGRMLLESPLKGRRMALDIASDGRNNNGGPPGPVRDRLARSLITINGLVIRNEYPVLNRHFRLRVVGGPGHFVEIAESYDGYARALKRKLLREIEGPKLW